MLRGILPESDAIVYYTASGGRHEEHKKNCHYGTITPIPGLPPSGVGLTVVRLPAWYARFVSPTADRGAVIHAELEYRGVSAKTLELGGGRFVVAWPRNRVRDPRYRIKVLTAHHDRVPGTPGALDNSAACVQLVDFLSSEAESFNTLVVFTDREELGGLPPAEQGSYAVGKAFAGMGIRAPMVFPFDVTGRGGAIVLSRAADTLVARLGKAAEGFGGLSAIVEETDAMAVSLARIMAGRAPVFRMAVPFGEDLGFICAGIPALTVTMLPREEAEALAARSGLPSWASPSAPGSSMPATWRCLHGSGDEPGLYTVEAFEVVGRLLSRLSAWRVPAPVA